MASAEGELEDLKSRRSRLRSKITARSGQPGYAINVEGLKAELQSVNDQIAVIEAELAAQAEEQNNGGEPDA